jgi:hypothetical protein
MCKNTLVNVGAMFKHRFELFQFALSGESERNICL